MMMINYSDNLFLGGRLLLRQPLHGFRAGLDAIMLAAAVDEARGLRIGEFGAGIGAVSLALAQRIGLARLQGFEIDESLVEIAGYNSAANGLAERVQFAAGDIVELPALSSGFDQIVMNPPFHAPLATAPSPIQVKNRARIESDLSGWIEAAARQLRPLGWVSMIFRSDRLAILIETLGATGFGNITYLQLIPRLGKPPKRVLVRAQYVKNNSVTNLEFVTKKMGSTPPVEAPSLILHEGSGYSAATETILRHAAPLIW